MDILGPIFMAVIVTLIDFIFMVKDITGDAKTIMSHTLSSLVFILILVFAAFNLDLVLGLSFLPEFIKNQTLILVVLGLIATIGVHAKSALFQRGLGGGGRGIGGADTHITWMHSLIIGITIATAPYIWAGIAPMVEEYLSR
jgi:hypothetical protein